VQLQLQNINTSVFAERIQSFQDNVRFLRFLWLLDWLYLPETPVVVRLVFICFTCRVLRTVLCYSHFLQYINSLLWFNLNDRSNARSINLSASRVTIHCMHLKNNAQHQSENIRNSWEPLILFRQLDKFLLFEKNLLLLSEFASGLPQNLCSADEVRADDAVVEPTGNTVESVTPVFDESHSVGWYWLANQFALITNSCIFINS
jgi:hypothetical protein